MTMAEPDWSRLPKDILILIAKRLGTQIDILRVCSVCHSWRSPIIDFKHKRSSPLTLPFPIYPNPNINENRRGHFALSQTTIYFLPPPPQESTSKFHNPWLFRVEELKNEKHRTDNSLMRFLTRNMRPDLPKVLSLLDFPAIEIGRTFRLEYVETSDNTFKTDFNETDSLVCHKAVVSSDPFTTNADDLEVMASQGGKLWFIRLGNKEWIYIDDFKESDDFIYHKRKFYVVDGKGKTVVVGSDLKVVQVADPIHDSSRLIMSLAKFGDDLYLIDCQKEGMKANAKFYFKCYKLDEANKKWDMVRSLDDKLVFYGDNVSYVTCAKDFKGMQPNRIYYRDKSITGENENVRLCGTLSSFKILSNILLQEA